MSGGGGRHEWVMRGRRGHGAAGEGGWRDGAMER